MSWSDAGPAAGPLVPADSQLATAHTELRRTCSAACRGVRYFGRNDFPYTLTNQCRSFLGHWPETGLLSVIYFLRVDSKC